MLNINNKKLQNTELHEVGNHIPNKIIRRGLKVILVTIFFLSSATAFSQQDFNTDTIYKYFKEIETICNKDNGELWGTNLWSPILVINKDTRKIIANEPDNAGLLQKKGDCYIGKFPENKIIANSITYFGDKLWTMVAYPLPTKKNYRNELFIHEMFHYFQESSNLEYRYDNTHIDKMQARIYLKLEWSALEKAIISDNTNIEAITDAALAMGLSTDHVQIHTQTKINLNFTKDYLTTLLMHYVQKQKQKEQKTFYLIKKRLGTLKLIKEVLVITLVLYMDTYSTKVE